MSEKRLFKFKIIYFKENGKYYTEALVEWEVRLIANSEGYLAYYHDAVAKLRGLRDNDGPEALPGLCGNGWKGPILIEQATLIQGRSENSMSPDDYYCDGVPHLLMP